MTRVGVVVFPGSCDDRDAMRAVETMGADAVALWHGDAGYADSDATLDGARHRLWMFRTDPWSAGDVDNFRRLSGSAVTICP